MNQAIFNVINRLRMGWRRNDRKFSYCRAMSKIWPFRFKRLPLSAGAETAALRPTVAGPYCAGIVPGQTEARWDALEILRHKVTTLAKE